MRIAVLLFALLLPTTALGGESVTFRFAPLRSGETLAETEAMNMAFDVQMFAGDTLMGTLSAKNTANNDFVAKLGKWTGKKRTATFTYGANSEVESKGMGDKVDRKETPSAVANQSYAVKLDKDGTVAILNKGGGDVSDEERTEILEDWEELIENEADEFSATLVGKTMQVGDALDAESDAVKSFLAAIASDNELTAKDASFTLSELRTVDGEQCAVFLVALNIDGGDDEVAMTMALAGEVVVGVKTLRPQSVTLEGPLTLSASGESDGVTMRMDGTGSVSLGFGYRYSK